MAQGYDSTPSRNTMRAAGDSASGGGSTVIPGKVAETPTASKPAQPEGTPAEKGSGVRGFTGGGLMSPFVTGTKMGTDEGGKAD